MKKVRTKAAFETRANRVISRGPGEIIRMGDEDIAEVADLVEVIEEAAPPGLGISVNETIQTVDHGPGKKKK
jgi:hypothetical protein